MSILESLRRRQINAVEEMDKPDCDANKLYRTYAQFSLINRVVSGWRWAYVRHLRPRFATTGPTTLVDIGCGGGDIPRALARWAARDGLQLQITAIDSDNRAYRFAKSEHAVPGLVYRRASSSELVSEGRQFDFVISNHVLHHLRSAELAGLLADSEVLCRRAAIHNDIARSRLAYVLFFTGTLPFFHRSFLRQDGLTSIRRSYTARELRRELPQGWVVEEDFRFRNLVIFERGANVY